MIYVLLWIVLCFLCGKYAKNKGMSFNKFFFIAFFLSPLISFIWVYITPEDMEKVEYTKIVNKQSKRCPHCDELVRILANKCKHCGGDLSGSKSDGGKEICSKCNEPRVGKFIKKCLNCGKMFND